MSDHDVAAEEYASQACDDYYHSDGRNVAAILSVGERIAALTEELRNHRPYRSDGNFGPR